MPGAGSNEHMKESSLVKQEDVLEEANEVTFPKTNIGTYVEYKEVK